MTTPVTHEELTEWAETWIKLNGIDSLIAQYIDYQLFMMQKNKEYRKIIKELKHEAQ